MARRLKTSYMLEGPMKWTRERCRNMSEGTRHPRRALVSCKGMITEIYSALVLYLRRDPSIGHTILFYLAYLSPGNMPLQCLGSGGMVSVWELGNATGGINANATNSSSSHISDVRVHASDINLNSQLLQADSAHVLSGKIFMLPYKTFTCTSSALPDSNDHDSKMSRSSVRLCALFQTFARYDIGAAKQVNTFWSHVSTTGVDGITSVFQFGDKRWSELDLLGSQQHDCYLLQIVCYSNYMVSSVSLHLYAYNNTNFIAAWDCERVPQSTMSGYNTSRGQMVTSSWKGLRVLAPTVLRQLMSYPTTIVY